MLRKLFKYLKGHDYIERSRSDSFRSDPYSLKEISNYGFELTGLKFFSIFSDGSCNLLKTRYLENREYSFSIQGSDNLSDLDHLLNKNSHSIPEQQIALIIASYGYDLNILYCHDQSTDIKDNYNYLTFLSKKLGFNLILWDYPSFGLSTGTNYTYQNCSKILERLINYFSANSEDESNPPKWVLWGDNFGVKVIMNFYLNDYHALKYKKAIIGNILDNIPHGTKKIFSINRNFQIPTKTWIRFFQQNCEPKKRSKALKKLEKYFAQNSIYFDHPIYEKESTVLASFTSAEIFAMSWKIFISLCNNFVI